MDAVIDAMGSPVTTTIGPTWVVKTRYSPSRGRNTSEGWCEGVSASSGSETSEPSDPRMSST